MISCFLAFVDEEADLRSFAIWRGWGQLLSSSASSRQLFAVECPSSRFSVSSSGVSTSFPNQYPLYPKYKQQFYLFSTVHDSFEESFVRRTELRLDPPHLGFHLSPSTFRSCFHPSTPHRQLKELDRHDYHSHRSHQTQEGRTTRKLERGHLSDRTEYGW